MQEASSLEVEIVENRRKLSATLISCKQNKCFKNVPKNKVEEKASSETKKGNEDTVFVQTKWTEQWQ